MSSSENRMLVVITACVNCGQSIELVTLTSQDTGDEFLFWRHITSGMYGCNIYGRGLFAEDNLATPDWDEVFR